LEATNMMVGECTTIFIKRGQYSQIGLVKFESKGQNQQSIMTTNIGPLQPKT
jgi:hypothetical protein